MDLSFITWQWAAENGAVPFAIWLAIRFDIKLIHAHVKDLKEDVKTLEKRFNSHFDKS